MAFLAAAAPALAIAGAGISAFGSIQSGLYAGQVGRNNAQIAEQNAEYTRQAGAVQADTQSRKGAAQAARLKTTQAASGIDVNTGSAVDVQAGDRETSKLDTETILSNADLSAYGYTTQAKNFEAQSKQDETAGFIGAAGTLLESASSLAPKWKIGGAKPANSWTEARHGVFGS